MLKEKIEIKARIIHFFTYHPLLKIIAFLLAVVIWFYVTGEIARDY